MPDAKLLTDDELKAIADRNIPCEDVPASCQFDISDLLSHIAAQAAEIARLRAVPEALFRYKPDSELHGMDECDTGKYVEYDELVAEIGGKQ